MKKLYFGGSFNPIHIGHLMAARYAVETLGLDKVVLIPCKSPYHKQVQMASYDARVLTVKAAVKDDPIFEVSEIESSVTGNSYTFDTLQRLTNDFEEHPYWLIGSDNVEDVLKWHRFNELKEKVTFVIARRGNGYVKGLRMGMPYKYDLLNVPVMDISSTEIRERIAKGLPVKWMVPDAVEEIIRTTNLYKSA